MISNNFLIVGVDKCIYTKIENDTCVIVCLYIDYIFIFSYNMKLITSTKTLLLLYFDMKDLGEANVILRIKIPKAHVDIFYHKNIT